MNQQLKTRLVGAIVLISLAVIFIPMLLDGGGQESISVQQGLMPDSPGYRFEPLEIPLQPPPPAPTAPRLVDSPPPASEPRAEPPPKASPAPSPAPAAAPPVAQATPSPPKPAAPAPSRETTLQVGWVVQVGSFSRQDNAIGLRDRLRGKGFTTFVDQASGADGTVWRVRVGPELERERAERLKQRLEQEVQLNGIVVSHGQ